MGILRISLALVFFVYLGQQYSPAPFRRIDVIFAIATEFPMASYDATTNTALVVCP